MLTGKPNYPSGKYYSGYHFWGVKKEIIEGATIIRVPLINRGKSGGGLRIILNYLSYVFFSNWYIRTHNLNFDATLCFEISPITQMYPALLLKKKTGCKATIWVQDLWPESIKAVTNFNNLTVKSLLHRMVTKIYQKTDTIFVQSKAFINSITSKGDFLDKIVYAPNWAEDIFVNNSSADNSKYQHLIPDGFIVMYAGNIGAAQDIQNILKAAVILKEREDIKWLFIGDGREKSAAEAIVEQENLKNVFFLGRYPLSEMPSFYVHADVMLASLKDEEIFSLTIPSRIQSYMAFGKPIVTMLSGIGNDIINEAKCGFTSASGDYNSLANSILAASRMDKTELSVLGDNGRQYYNQFFSKEKIIKTIEDNLL